jgi:hypothetical protein
MTLPVDDQAQTMLVKEATRLEYSFLDFISFLRLPKRSSCNVRKDEIFAQVQQRQILVQIHL